MQLRGLPDDGVGHCELVAHRGKSREAQIVAVEVNDLSTIHRLDGAICKRLAALYEHPLSHFVDGYRRHD